MVITNTPSTPMIALLIFEVYDFTFCSSSFPLDREERGQKMSIHGCTVVLFLSGGNWS